MGFSSVCKESILDGGISTPKSTSQTLVNNLYRELFLVVNEKFENFSLFTFFDPKFEGLKINVFLGFSRGALETGRNQSVEESRSSLFFAMFRVY